MCAEMVKPAGGAEMENGDRKSEKPNYLSVYRFPNFDFHLSGHQRWFVATFLPYCQVFGLCAYSIPPKGAGRLTASVESKRRGWNMATRLGYGRDSERLTYAS